MRSLSSPAGWIPLLRLARPLARICDDYGKSVLLRINLKPQHYDRKDFIDHCQVLLSLFLDIFLGVTLLKVNQLVRCCYCIAFREFEIKLADVNRFLRDESPGFRVHFAQDLASSTDHHLICGTSQTGQRG